MKTKAEIRAVLDALRFAHKNREHFEMAAYQAAYADGQADENEACEEKCRSWNATLADEIRARRTR